MGKAPVRYPSYGGIDISDATAVEADVKSGKTFYAVLQTKRTGTLALTGNAIAGDVRSGKTFYNTDPSTKLTGTADLSKHADDQNSIVGTSSYSTNCRYFSATAGSNILSKSITTTKRCLIVVVAFFICSSGTQVSDIKRGGMTKTAGTTISSQGFATQYNYGHLQYAYEVLDAGTYTYDLVSFYDQEIFGAMMKLVAVTF